MAAGCRRTARHSMSPTPKGARLWAFEVQGPGKLKPKKEFLPAQRPHDRGPERRRALRQPQGHGERQHHRGDLNTGYITEISPAGDIVRAVKMPDLYPTNICFGGADMRTAYITLSDSGQIGRDAVAGAGAEAQLQLQRSRPSAYRFPAEPVADRLAHDELLVGFRDPVDLLEVGHALAPGAGHLGDVGAPEQPPGTESVVHGAVVLVQAAERVGVVGIERTAGQLDGHVRILGQRRQLLHVRKRRIALGASERAHVVHRQLQPGMAGRDLARAGAASPGEQGQRNCAFSAAGQSQSSVPSVGQDRLCGLLK